MNQIAELVFRSSSELDTEWFAFQLAGWFEAGTVIALDGDLSAGKTRFSQAVAKALGVIEWVSSPTFAIIKEYEGTRLPFYHMDVYRISVIEAEELGLDEYFYGEGVSVVEWSSIIASILPQHHLHLFIKAEGEQERIIRLTAYGEPYITWVRELKRIGVE